MPKWLGSFECELHPIIKQIQNTKYSAVINVGCAEGYYAVGLAKLFPEVQVFGFDIDPLSRRQTRKLAKLNGVFQNLTISGRCDHNIISSLVANHNGPILMICDIEGAEIDLLNPLNCGSLHKIDILVEIHDMPGDNRIAKAMAGVFSQNHTIEVVKYSNRENWVNQNVSDAVFGGASKEWLLRMTDEYRISGQTWLWMKCNKKC
jgi:SAM-dependent methyltransferase